MSHEKIDWPSDRVPQGGLFHPAKVAYSKETHDLIKTLMAEQKMTMFQRKRVNYHLLRGETLPQPQLPQMVTKQDYEDQLAMEILKRARIARKRPLDQIRASGAFEAEKYVNPRHLRETSNVQKTKLQETMSGLKEYPELDALRVGGRHKVKRYPNGRHVPRDPIDEIMDEIQERADWLADMEELGEAKDHRTVILGQIAERLRRVKQLERRREEKERQAAGDSVMSLN